MSLPILHGALPSTGWVDVTHLWPSITAGSVEMCQTGGTLWLRWASAEYSASGVEYASADWLPSTTGDIGVVHALADTPTPRRVTIHPASGLAVVRPTISARYNGILCLPLT